LLVEVLDDDIGESLSEFWREVLVDGKGDEEDFGCFEADSFF
jgi:hypothetical protein